MSSRKQTILRMYAKSLTKNEDGGRFGLSTFFSSAFAFPFVMVTFLLGALPGACTTK